MPSRYDTSVRELVIIISDLYLPPREAGQRKAAASLPLPGLEQAARFGRKAPLGADWRPWLARWLRRDDLARAAPATIVAAASEAARLAMADNTPAAVRIAGAAALADSNATAWLATPVYLIASLTSLHLDPRSILHLSPDERATLAEDFNRTFADSRFRLESVGSGALVMHARDAVNAVTTEPARALASELEASLPGGPDAAALKRLGAELEMWLHAHPVNDARARRGELPVSTLWLWGGGTTAGLHDTSAPGAATAGSHEHSTALFASATTGGAASPDLLFGSDPYVIGLLSLHDAAPRALPDHLPDLHGYPGIQRAALVTEITPLLHTNPHWTVFEALADLDHRFIAPALVALRRGATAAVVLIANDIQLRVERGDFLKFWRRRRQSVLDELRSG